LAGIASGGIKKLNAVKPSGKNLNAKKGERKMKRLLFLILSATIVLGSVFVGWAQEPYKIGVVNNSTGALGMFGIVQNRGIELAAEVINKAGGVDGHKIVPIIYDGETKPDVNLRMARKLINQDKIKVLIGPNFMAGIKSIGPVVNEKKIPMTNFGATVIDPAKDPYMFSFGSNNTIMAQALVEYYHKKGIKKIAIIAVKSSYGEEFAAAYRDCMRKYPDMSIVATEWFMYEDTDITPQITKLISRAELPLS
jgi:branched-chain amino acid transport system substrate-binding protein